MFVIDIVKFFEVLGFLILIWFLLLFGTDDYIVNYVRRLNYLEKFTANCDNGLYRRYYCDAFSCRSFPFCWCMCSCDVTVKVCKFVWWYIYVLILSIPLVVCIRVQDRGYNSLGWNPVIYYYCCPHAGATISKVWQIILHVLYRVTERVCYL